MNRDSAEEIAVAALGFVAGDPELLSRFLAITGIQPSMIRAAASQPGFLAGVLEFVLAHEPTLVKFCEQTGVQAERVAPALQALPTGDGRYERST